MTYFDDLWRAERVKLSNHATHYGRRTNFPYYDLALPPLPNRDDTYPPPLVDLCVVLWEPSPVPSFTFGSEHVKIMA
jgi:hypothetical protein